MKKFFLFLLAAMMLLSLAACSSSDDASDLAYISLRLALIRLLYRSLRPALIFDESFSRLDDNRLKCALNVLFTAAAEGTQSIIFTSHTRDADIMDTIGEYDYVRLS